EVDAGHAVDLVERFTGILLEMGARQANGLFAFGADDSQAPALHDRALVLADLVALRQIGIEVVLAREDRTAVDAAAGGEAKADGVLERRAIQYRQRAGQREVDGGGLRIGRRTEVGRRGGEDLASRA